MLATALGATLTESGAAGRAAKHRDRHLTMKAVQYRHATTASSASSASSVPTPSPAAPPTAPAPVVPVPIRRSRRAVLLDAVAATIGVAALGLSSRRAAASAAPVSAATTVRMGGPGGELAFFPSAVTIHRGESVTWENASGFPHNVVFTAVPEGVDAAELSHADLFDAPGERWTQAFPVPGTYEYECEPHAGLDMAGRVVVD